nr:MAG TPA: hypothetical protein [Caudoviricetes sp.]
MILALPSMSLRSAKLKLPLYLIWVVSPYNIYFEIFPIFR